MSYPPQPGQSDPQWTGPQSDPAAPPPPPAHDPYAPASPYQAADSYQAPADPFSGPPADPYSGQQTSGVPGMTSGVPGAGSAPPGPYAPPPAPYSGAPAQPAFKSSGDPYLAAPDPYQPAPDPYAAYPAAPGYGYPAPGGGQTNGLAVASMVLGILALVGLCAYGQGGWIGLPAAILGHIGRRQARERGEQGDGMALAGLIMGWIGTAVALIALIFIVMGIVWLSNNAPSSTYDYN